MKQEEINYKLPVLQIVHHTTCSLFKTFITFYVFFFNTEDHCIRHLYKRKIMQATQKPCIKAKEWKVAISTAQYRRSFSLTDLLERSDRKAQWDASRLVVMIWESSSALRCRSLVFVMQKQRHLKHKDRNWWLASSRCMFTAPGAEQTQQEKTVIY